MSKANIPASVLAGFTSDDIFLRRLNEVLKQYEGTHNFHNFTQKMAGNDKAAKRYILSFSSPGKFIINVNPFLLLCCALLTLCTRLVSSCLHDIVSMIHQES